MFYVLNLHGKWLDRSGKLIFNTYEEMHKYIDDMYDACLPFLLKSLDIKTAQNKIRISYSYFEISDNSPLKDCFTPTKVQLHKQFSQRKHHVRKITPKEIAQPMEESDKIRTSDAEGITS